MEPLQEQVTLLTQKVDAIYQSIEQVNLRMTEIVSTAQIHSAETTLQGHGQSARIRYGSGLQRSESMLSHKDVLVDSDYIDPERSGDEISLSPEVQIQRLTAQLTAAYNRIAALEEQLLASRTY